MNVGKSPRGGDRLLLLLFLSVGHFNRTIITYTLQGTANNLSQLLPIVDVGLQEGLQASEFPFKTINHCFDLHKASNLLSIQDAHVGVEESGYIVQPELLASALTWRW